MNYLSNYKRGKCSRISQARFWEMSWTSDLILLNTWPRFRMSAFAETFLRCDLLNTCFWLLNTYLWDFHNLDKKYIFKKSKIYIWERKWGTVYVISSDMRCFRYPTELPKITDKVKKGWLLEGHRKVFLLITLALISHLLITMRDVTPR